MHRASKVRNLKINRRRKLPAYWALSTATLFFCLTGCMGVYEGGFECPPGEGVGCKSISEVNEMVNQCSVLPKVGLPKAVLSTQCSECKIPRADNQDSTAEIFGQPQEDLSIPQIWYAPEAFMDFSLIEA